MRKLFYILSLFFLTIITACVHAVANDDYDVYDFISSQSGIVLEDNITTISTIVEKYEFVDDARITRRTIEENTKFTLLSPAQIYIDFLQKIFSVVPNRGAPFECSIPKQALGYGILYLQHLF